MLGRACLLLWLGLVAGAAWAQVTPPDGSRVLTTTGNLSLSWPGSSRSEYTLVVSQQGRPIFGDTVVGNVVRLGALRPGLYRWQVAPRGQAPSEFHSFQICAPQLVFDGRAGRPGKLPGEPGSPGGPGQTLTVRLTGGPGYWHLHVRGFTTQEYLVWPGTGPILISARGGAGGDGAPGRPAGPMPLDAGGTIVWLPGGSALPGGAGGPGGPGGRVAVESDVAGAESVLQILVEGGSGGRGGPGGEPGGGDGPDGPPGAPGQVRFR